MPDYPLESCNSIIVDNHESFFWDFFKDLVNLTKNVFW
jgi:hypothetical protein